MFTAAILANAPAVVLAHKHPSGNPTPSPEDHQVTRRLSRAGELLGIHVPDHVIVGQPGYVSFRERGLLRRAIADAQAQIEAWRIDYNTAQCARRSNAARVCRVQGGGRRLPPARLQEDPNREALSLSV